LLNSLSVIVFLYLTLLHAGPGWFRVVNIPPEKYQQSGAVDLKITPELRYGYVSAQHGAFLVKTQNGAAFTSYQPNNDYEKIEFDWMKKDLESYRRRANLEAVFYGTVWAYAFVLIPWLRWKIQGIRWPGRTILRGLFWAGGWVLIATPLILLDYGASLYTTWNGPGALSWSGPYFGTVTGFNAETISYRTFVELTGAPAASALINWVPDGLALSTRDYVFWSGILFYGMLGCILEAGGSVLRAFIRRKETTQNGEAEPPADTEEPN
jgi:hypothetical protein